jgi:hypothetical protein
MGIVAGELALEPGFDLVGRTMAFQADIAHGNGANVAKDRLAVLGDDLAGLKTLNLLARGCADVEVGKLTRFPDIRRTPLGIACPSD